MRIDVVFGLILLATALDASSARAGWDCCTAWPFPQVIYGLPPVPYALSPTGHVFNPWDAARPSYLINQGPQLPSLGAFARVHPTYAEAGYAPANEYPFIISHGSGGRFGYRAVTRRPIGRAPRLKRASSRRLGRAVRDQQRCPSMRVLCWVS